MSEQRNDDKPATRADLAIVVAVLGVILLLLSISDSCRVNMHYRDLRERLERIEQSR
jgi:hypothetical protein